MNCYLLYDWDEEKTVGVVKGNELDPNVFPDDDLGWLRVGQAWASHHRVEAIPCPLHYLFALRKFHNHKLGDLDLIFYCDSSSSEREKRLQDRETRFLKQGRRSVTDKISEENREEVCSLSRRGFSVRDIAARLDISSSSVRRILKKKEKGPRKSEKPGSEASDDEGSRAA